MAEGEALSYFLDIKARLNKGVFTQIEKQALKIIQNLSAALPPIMLKLAIDTGSLAAIRQQIGGAGGISASEAEFRGSRPLNPVEETSRRIERLAKQRAAGLTRAQYAEVARSYARDTLDRGAMNRATLQSDVAENAKMRKAQAAMNRAALETKSHEWYSTFTEGLDKAGKKLNKYGEVVDKNADSTKKANEAMTPFRHMMDLWGKGQIRRGVAVGTTETLGGGAAAELLGGLMGTVGSAIALPIAWAIGNALMAIPGFALGKQEAVGGFSARALTPEGKAEMEEARAVSRPFWAGAESGGEAAWTATYTTLYNAGMRGQEAKDVANQAMMMKIGGAKGEDFSEKIAEMYHNPGSDANLAMLQGNPQLEDALKKNLHGTLSGMYGNYDQLSKQSQHGLLMNLVKGDVIGSENIRDAMTTLTDKGGGYAATAKEHATSKMGRIRAAASDVGEAVSTYFTGSNLLKILMSGGVLGSPAEHLWNAARTGHRRVVDDVVPVAGAGAARGAAGGQGGDMDKAKPDAGHPVQYSWTSFSGLAEQMQTMYSGAPVDAMATATEKFDKAVDKWVAANGGKGVAQPADAAANVPPL